MRPFVTWLRTVKRPLRRVAWLAAIGVILLLCILQSELLWLPASLDSADRLVYRGAFLIICPFRPIVALAIPRIHHHWPLSHLVVSALGTPFFFAVCFAGVKRAWRRLAARKQARRATPEPAGIPRRQFLKRTTAVAAGLATTSVSGYASVIEPSRLKIREYEIDVRDLPKDLEGLRLVHVSDTHYGPFTGSSFLNEVADVANTLNGDVIVFTGDYCHFTPLSIEPGIQLLSKFNARLGAVAVLGNHEHWEGADACRRAFAKIGLPLIDNDRLFLSSSGISPTPVLGASMCLAGLGDYWEDQVLIDKALDGVPPGMARIVLAHNPDTAELIRRDDRVDLMLSGHTHGGQVSLPIVGAPVVGSLNGQKYLGGLCHGPFCPVLVSRGVGTAFIPVRFRVPPELGVITLKRGHESLIS